jgi:hypothetical protein
VYTMPRDGAASLEKLKAKKKPSAKPLKPK